MGRDPGRGSWKTPLCRVRKTAIYLWVLQHWVEVQRMKADGWCRGHRVSAGCQPLHWCSSSIPSPCPGCVPHRAAGTAPKPGKERPCPTSPAANLTPHSSGPLVHVTHGHSLANRFMLIYSFRTCLTPPQPFLRDGMGRDEAWEEGDGSPAPPTPLSPLPPAHAPVVPVMQCNTPWGFGDPQGEGSAGLLPLRAGILCDTTAGTFETGQGSWDDKDSARADVAARCRTPQGWALCVQWAPATSVPPQLSSLLLPTLHISTRPFPPSITSLAAPEPPQTAHLKKRSHTTGTRHDTYSPLFG